MNHRLDGNLISATGMKKLVNSLIYFKSLKILFLNYNSIGDEGLKRLGELIKQNKSLEEVYISKTDISDEGIKVFIPFVVHSQTIKRIDISTNEKITNESVALLLDFANNSNIEEINTVGTSIKPLNQLILPLYRNSFKNGANKLDYRSL